MFGLSRTLTSIAATAIAVILLLGFLYLQSCSAERRAAQEARMNKGQAEASISAGEEAMNTVSNVSAADARIDATVKGGTDEIRSQPAGRSNAAAVRAACRLRSFCADQRCAALRSADPAIAACRSAVGATP